MTFLASINIIPIMQIPRPLNNLFYLFVTQLTTPSVAQIIKRRIIDWSMIMGWKGSFSDLRHYSCIFLWELRKDTRNICERSRFSCRIFELLATEVIAGELFNHYENFMCYITAPIIWDKIIHWVDYPRSPIFSMYVIKERRGTSKTI